MTLRCDSHGQRENSQIWRTRYNSTPWNVSHKVGVTDNLCTRTKGHSYGYIQLYTFQYLTQASMALYPGCISFMMLWWIVSIPHVLGTVQQVEIIREATFPKSRLCTVSLIGEAFGHTNIVPVSGSAFISWLKDGRKRTYLHVGLDNIIVHGTVLNAVDAANVVLEVRYSTQLDFDEYQRLEKETTTFWYWRSYTLLVRTTPASNWSRALICISHTIKDSKNTFVISCRNLVVHEGDQIAAFWGHC